MKKIKSLILMVVLAALLVFLLNPAWNPLLDEGTKNAVQNETQSVFGVLAGGAPAGIFSPAKLLTAAAVLVFTWLATVLVCFVLDLTCAHKKRSQTVAGLVSSVVKAVGAIVALVWVLHVLGVNLAAIFASLGVVSLILGFGVQSLIEDCVTGVFIILENQYNIGDIVVLEDFRGTVKKITMRTTVIQDDGGNLKIVNNSDIRNIQNRSRANSIAAVNVGISYDADLALAEQVLEKELPQIRQRYGDLFHTDPKYMGVQSLSASSVDLRIVAEVAESDIYRAQRVLNREMKLLLDRHGIEIPFNQLVVHNSK